METNQSTQLNIFERINQWIEESITVKLLSIGFLVLILLIPSAWIQELMEERQLRADGVMQEVSAKWSGSQTLSGPILVIPYKVQEKIDRGKDGIEIREYKQKYFFLPEKLDITGQVTPETLHRGLFDVAVYNSTLDIKSNFTRPDFAALNVADNNVLWKEAYMIFSITDLRGINENLIFNVGDSAKTTEPSSNLGVSVRKISRYQNETATEADEYAEFSSSGVVAKLGWETSDDFTGNTLVKLSLKGSQQLNFVPSGKTTAVNLSGAWNDPSFDGEFLPEAREISESGFTASWKVLHYNRPFSQQWNTPD
jgi:inner membrane protein